MTLSKLEKQIADRRDPLARRYRKLVKELTGLLSDGEPNQAEVSVIKVAALITLECEQMTTAYLNGEKVSRTDIVRMANAATRLLEAIGVEKAKREPAHVSLKDQIIAERGKSHAKA